MKGIILAGGSGTRLYPSTIAVSKQLLPVYDKPVIYYPLSTLMMAGIKEIIIITRPDEQHLFKKVLKDGRQWGLKLEYTTQEHPNGLAEALILAEDFLAGDSSALVLGDNIFYGAQIISLLENSRSEFEKNPNEGARIFAYPVRNPKPYGIVELDKNGNALSIEEKPQNPKSNNAVVGLYFYDNRAPDFAKNLKPSARGELEITALNQKYLELGALKVTRFSRGYAWFDTGTHDAMMQASIFIQAVEERQGLKLACPEEIAFNKGFIDKTQLEKLTKEIGVSSYGDYLRYVLECLDKKQ